MAILSYVSFLHIQTLNSILYKWDHITCYLLIQGFKLLFKMLFWRVLGGAASYSWKSWGIVTTAVSIQELGSEVPDLSSLCGALCEQVKLDYAWREKDLQTQNETTLPAFLSLWLADSRPWNFAASIIMVDHCIHCWDEICDKNTGEEYVTRILPEQVKNFLSSQEICHPWLRIESVCPSKSPNRPSPEPLE